MNLTEAKEILKNNILFASSQDGKWGFVDKDGRKVIEYKYAGVIYEI